MKNLRLRNLLLPVVLAALAAVLVGVYVVSYRDSVKDGAGLVKVMVASRDIPAGTKGSEVASGGYLKTEMVPRRAVVTGSVVSASPLTSRVVTNEIYKGEQITLRQFAPAEQGGIFAKFSGNERAVTVLGEPQQLLSGTLTDGDHVDVVATARYHVGMARATSKVVLRNLLVLKAPDEATQEQFANNEKMGATLVMTDSQAQTMGWAMHMSNWFLALRPTATPRNSKESLETLQTFLGRGLPATKANEQIVGTFPGGVDEP